MKKLFRNLQKIQWRLTFTYMAATLVMLFLVELSILVSNNRDSFSNPFFVNSAARSLNESSRNLLNSLDEPYDQETLNQWIEFNKNILQSNRVNTRPAEPKPPIDTQKAPQSTQISVFQSKPVPFSRENSRLVITDPEGIIISADDEDLFPLETDITGYLNENEIDMLQRIISDAENTVVFSGSGYQYASFMFSILEDGESKAIVFMRIVAPTITEELLAAFEGFLPDLPVFLAISVIVGIIFGSLLASSFTIRLKKLVEFTSRWGKGDFSKIDKIRGADEIDELSIALNEMVDQFEELIESKKMLAVLEERNRFARDLHDSVKQQIFSISMNLSAIKSLINRDPEKASEQLDVTANIAKQARSELSTLIYTLLPAQLENQALENALKDYVKVWEKNSGISVLYRTHGKKREIPQEIEQSIFRIIQEALSNIARHSQATATSIILDYQPEGIQLQISDNGTGFEMKNVKKGLGLRSITERVAENQGKLDVDSGLSGTTITLNFPYSKTETGGADE